jgi:hypothetical protein
MLRLRVVFATLAGIAGLTFAATGLTFAATGHPARVSIPQTATCTDRGGAVWHLKTAWGPRYRSRHGATRVHTYATSFTTHARAATTVDYTIKTYNGAGQLLQTLHGRNRAFDFKAGTAWLKRNVINPLSAPGKTHITVHVGDGNDRKADCSVSFRQPPRGPVTPSSPARPARPAKPAKPAKPATPATPARPATPAPPAPPATPVPPAPPSTPASAADTFGWGPVAAGDEFNYVGRPDGSKWSVYNGRGNAGNGLRRTSQITVDGSTAIITGTSDGTTGGMSADFDHRRYGRWETRMRVSDRDPQYHPVLILWPDADSQNCEEVDYAEASEETGIMRLFNHYSCSHAQTYASKALDATQWHNYAVQVTAAGVVGYIDGVEWFRDAAHVPTGPMHQTIQLDWFPSGSATRESWLQVDWVRVYD